MKKTLILLIVLIGCVSLSSVLAIPETLMYGCENFSDAGANHNNLVVNGMTINNTIFKVGTGSCNTGGSATNYAKNDTPTGIATGEHNNSYSFWWYATSDPSATASAFWGTHKTGTNYQSWYATFNGNDYIQQRSNGDGAPSVA